MENRRKTGSGYEDLAAACLEEKGMRILERNFHARHGEIDLIAQDKKTLVFVEVKGRKNDHCGDPAEAVTFEKQAAIRMAARVYLMKRHLSEETPCRFDVVSICGEDVRHLKDAF
ncbi:MAG: YraN family protein [Lachnospiraceae bacterium]|nr:YraN family protein [Lachnospiraceae bacterium]